MTITPEDISGTAGGSVIGTIVAWFTLKGKIEKMIVIHNEFKKTTEETLKRIEASLKEHSTKVVYTDTCVICRENKDNQMVALHEKLDLLLERRKKERTGQ